jgi:hypothetical protein
MIGWPEITEPLLRERQGMSARDWLKLAHLPEADHEALILAGNLEGFDVGAVAQPPVFSSMPATLIPSPGTTVRVAVLFRTAAQQP